MLMIFFVIDILRKDNIYSTFHALSKMHKDIKCTLEPSKNNFINFLDFLIQVNNNTIQTYWYRKPMYLGRILHFLSNHAMHMKKAMVYNLEAVLSSRGDFHKNNIKLVKKILKINHYPVDFVNKHIRIKLNILTNTEIIDSKNFEHNVTLFVVLPYSICKKESTEF